MENHYQHALVDYELDVVGWRRMAGLQIFLLVKKSEKRKGDKMICTKLAKKVLTKKEQRHLSENGINSMTQFLKTREYQIELKAESGLESCFECNHIAQKLGEK